jgi:hypothetical protein
MPISTADYLRSAFKHGVSLRLHPHPVAILAFHLSLVDLTKTEGGTFDNDARACFGGRHL